MLTGERWAPGPALYLESTEHGGLPGYGCLGSWETELTTVTLHGGEVAVVPLGVVSISEWPMVGGRADVPPGAPQSVDFWGAAGWHAAVGSIVSAIGLCTQVGLHTFIFFPS